MLRTACLSPPLHFNLSSGAGFRCRPNRPQLYFYYFYLLLSPDIVQLTVVSVMKEMAEVEGSGGARDGQGRNV